MKFLMAILLSIIAIIGLSEAVSSESIDNLAKEIIEARDEATYLAFLQRDLDVLRERSIDIAPNPPTFSTFAEYEVFEKQEAQESPQECSQTSNEQTCQTCIAVTLGAFLSGLALCKNTNNINTPDGKVAAVTCAIGVTALFWISKIKCLGV